MKRNLIRNLPAKERLFMRRQNVRLKVDSSFRFANEFDTDTPGVSNKMKDAIMYTRNQKNTCAGSWRMGISLLTTGMPRAA